MGVGVAVACARRGTAYVNLPFVDEFSAGFNFILGNVANPAVLINCYITFAFACVTPKVGAKSERA